MKKKDLDRFLDLPIWLQPEAVPGSAVRYVASLSGRVHWVGLWKEGAGKKGLVVSIGDSKDMVWSRSFHVVTKQGKLLGRLEVMSAVTEGLLSPDIEQIEMVAQELARFLNPSMMRGKLV